MGAKGSEFPRMRRTVRESARIQMGMAVENRRGRNGMRR